ncbi:MAG: LysM peptidoglycan-binding domain-containing protein [Bacteroidota bacterium]|jgi:LysM repeat protein
MFSKNLIRFYLLVIVLLGSFSFAFAQVEPEVKWKDGKKYIIHQIKKGDTWSGIALKYKAPMKELQAINPKSKDLKFDQTILIPYDFYKNSRIITSEISENLEDKSKNNSTDTKSKEATTKVDSSAVKVNKAKTEKVAATTPKPKSNTTPPSKNTKTLLPDTIKAYKNTPKTHIVKPGETLYGIAAKYHMKFQDFAKLNSLTSTKIKIGQVLKIPQYVKVVHFTDTTKAPEPLTDTTKVIPRTIVKQVIDSLVLSPDDTLAPDSLKLVSGPLLNANPYEKFYFNNTAEQGVATWMMEASLNKKEKFYALHRTAPIGTIIKVINPMNKRFVFVKVVGPLPDTGDNHDVLIKITQSAARRIGIIDSRFRVDISYGIKGKPTSRK